MIKFTACFCALLLLYGCGSESDIGRYGETFEKITLSDKGHFRNVEIGDKMEKVKAAEKARITDESDNYLYYDITLDTTDYLTLAYYFDKDGLYEINADVFFESQEEALTLFSQFKEYFNEKYGESRTQEGYIIWKTKNNSSKNIEISLFNDISREGSGYLSINITDFDS